MRVAGKMRHVRVSRNRPEDPLVRRSEEVAREKSLVEFVAVLEVLDEKEREGTRDRDEEVDSRTVLLTELRGTDRHGRREAREEQHNRVEAADDAIQVVRRLAEHLGVPASVHAVTDEEPAEKEELLPEERPHSEL